MTASSNTGIHNLKWDNIVQVIILWDACLLAALFILSLECYFSYKAKWNKTFNIKKIVNKTSNLFYLLSLMLLINVFYDRIYQRKPEKALLSFGVSSKYAPMHLGGPMAILGFALYSSDGLLHRCFHRLISLKWSSSPAIPRTDVEYDLRQAANITDHPGMHNTNQ